MHNFTDNSRTVEIKGCLHCRWGQINRNLVTRQWVEKSNVIKNTDLMSNFTHIPSDIRSGCISLSYTNSREGIEKSWAKWKFIRLSAMISSQHAPWKSQLKSYAVLLAHYLISFSRQAKFLKCGKKVKYPCPQKGVFPDKRKLRTSDNTSSWLRQRTTESNGTVVKGTGQ